MSGTSYEAGNMDVFGFRSCSIISSTAVAADVGFLHCEATLYLGNNGLMMKARWHPIEWNVVCARVLWLPWKPLRLPLPVKGPYNWVLLSYYSLRFLHIMTSQSSSHLTTQVSAYLMCSKPSKHTAGLALACVTGVTAEVKDKGSSDTVCEC